MSDKQRLIYFAVIKIWANISSHKITDSERKFMSRISLHDDKLEIERIVPHKCTNPECPCDKGIHWSIFSQPIEAITQKEQNKLFLLAGRF